MQKVDRYEAALEMIADHLRGRWDHETVRTIVDQALNPPPLYITEPVTAWLIEAVSSNGDSYRTIVDVPSQKDIFVAEKQKQYDNVTVTELTGTRKVVIPEPGLCREEVTDILKKDYPHGYAKILTMHGKRCRIFAEWEEQPNA